MSERTTLSSGGVDLFVERWGNESRKSTVILAHGFGGSARNFRGQARHLENERQVVLFDARGHARSGAPTSADDYTPERFVGDLSMVVDTLGGDRPIVGGLSMGAGIALRYALANPDRVSGLVLSSFPRSAATPGHVDWAVGFADAIDREGIEAAGSRFAWAERSRFDPKAADLIRKGFVEHPPHALAHILRSLLAVQPAPAELADELRSLEIPALIVAGSDDAGSLPSCRALAELLPRAELVVVPNGGHVVNLTNPDEFNRALDGFLAKLEG